MVLAAIVLSEVRLRPGRSRFLVDRRGQLADALRGRCRCSNGAKCGSSDRDAASGDGVQVGDVGDRDGDSVSRRGDPSQRTGLHIGNTRHVDGLVGVRAHLESGAGKRTIKQLATVEGSLIGHTPDFAPQLGNFRLHSGAIRSAVGCVGRLHSQFTHALQHVAHFAQRAFSGLRQGNAVVGVAGCHIQAFDLGVHALGNCQASSVVFGAVDAQAGRQALHGGGQGILRSHQVALGIHRLNVGVDRAHI
jgi:hypothetical protein